MGIADIIIAALIAAALILAAAKLIRDKKAGKGCCGDCSSCRHGCGKK